MQIKIFVDEAPIYITDILSDELKTKSKQTDVLFVPEKGAIIVENLLKALETDKKAIIILTTNVDETKITFINYFTHIEAAGGVVQNEKKALLFIFRKGKWDLPKGKFETGESAEICAAREIEEETGIKNLQLKHKIGETYHIYKEKGKYILKTSHWFHFISTGKQIINAQTEEDITEVKWIETLNIKEPMANTYENIKDILTVFFDTP